LNSGGGTTEVTSVTIAGSGLTYTIVSPNIPPNVASHTGTTFTHTGNSTLTSGQTVSISADLANGIKLSATVNVS